MLPAPYRLEDVLAKDSRALFFRSTAMALTCLFSLFVSSVLLAGMVLYLWAAWTRQRSEPAATGTAALPEAAPMAGEVSATVSGAPTNLPNGVRVAEDELAYLWSENDDRRERWRQDPGIIPPIEELREAVSQALDYGNRKEIALARAALADALDPSRLSEPTDR